MMFGSSTATATVTAVKLCGSQAFRHLYVLATQPSCTEAVDVSSRSLVYAPLRVTLAPPNPSAHLQAKQLDVVGPATHPPPLPLQVLLSSSSSSLHFQQQASQWPRLMLGVLRGVCWRASYVTACGVMIAALRACSYDGCNNNGLRIHCIVRQR